MKIRIEGDHADLKAIHQLIYEQDNTILVEETNMSTPGIHSEPIVTTLVTVFTSAVAVALREFRKLMEAKYNKDVKIVENDTIREKNRQDHKVEMTKLYIEISKDNFKAVTLEDIDKIEIK